MKEHFISNAALRLLIENNDGILVKEEKEYSNGKLIFEKQEYLIPKVCLGLFNSLSYLSGLIPYFVRQCGNGVHVGLFKQIDKNIDIEFVNYCFKQTNKDNDAQFDRFDKYPKVPIETVITYMEECHKKAIQILDKGK